MSMTKELWNKLVISKIVSKVGQNWKGTEKINLTEFYAGTRPKFVMAHCMLEHIDCRRLWTVRSKSDIKVAYIFPMPSGRWSIWSLYCPMQNFGRQLTTKFSYENWILFGVGLEKSYGAIQSENVGNYDQRFSD